MAAKQEAGNLDSLGPYLGSSISAMTIYLELSSQSPLWKKAWIRIFRGNSPPSQCLPQAEVASRVSKMCKGVISPWNQ